MQFLKPEGSILRIWAENLDEILDFKDRYQELITNAVIIIKNYCYNSKNGFIFVVEKFIDEPINDNTNNRKE